MNPPRCKAHMQVNMFQVTQVVTMNPPRCKAHTQVNMFQVTQVVTMNPPRCKAHTQVNMFQVTQAAWEASSCPSHRCTRRNRDQKIWAASPSSSRRPCATQVVPTSAKNTGEINELRCAQLLPDSNVLSL